MKYRVLCKKNSYAAFILKYELCTGTGYLYCLLCTGYWHWHWHWVLLLQYCIYALCPGFGVLCYWLYWVLCYSKRVIRHCLSSLHYTLSALQMEYSPLSHTHTNTKAHTNTNGCTQMQSMCIAHTNTDSQVYDVYVHNRNDWNMSCMELVDYWKKENVWILMVVLKWEMFTGLLRCPRTQVFKNSGVPIVIWPSTLDGLDASLTP